MQILQAFGGPGRTAMAFSPTYSMYPEYRPRHLHRLGRPARAATTSRCRPRTPPRRCASANPDVVFLASPNNPTGTALPPEVVAAVYDATDGIVVVDEAYAEFRRAGTPSAVDLLDGRPAPRRHPHDEQGLRVRRRAARLPRRRPGGGRRVAAGAAAVPPVGGDPGGRLGRRWRTPTPCSATSPGCAPRATTWSSWLRAPGFTVPESDANFVLFGAFADRRAVWQGLLERGVLVREVGPPQWLRVTVGTEDEMDRFRDALLAVTRGEAGT